MIKWLIVFMLVCSTVLGQRVSLTVQDESSQTIIRRFEEKGLEVSYNKDIIPDQTVYLRLHNIKLSTALDIISQQTALDWSVDEDTITITELSPSFAQPLSESLYRRDLERLTGDEIRFIDNIRDPYNLTDAEIRRLRDMGIDRRDLEYSYTAQTDRTVDRTRGDDRVQARRSAVTQQQRASGLAHMIRETISPNQWRVPVEE